MAAEHTASGANNLGLEAVLMLSVGLLAVVVAVPTFIAALRSFLKRKSTSTPGETV